MSYDNEADYVYECALETARFQGLSEAAAVQHALRELLEFQSKK